MKKRNIKKDKYLIEEIQPRGGITFKNESFILTGSGYQTCIHIIDYPQTLRKYWLAQICNIPNTIATIDVTTVDTNEVKRNINRSMEEQDLRYQMTEHPAEKYEAKQRYAELNALLDELSRLKEIMKQVHIRIYVAAKTREELENRVKEITVDLDTSGYRATIMLNEMKREWNALYLPYKVQHKDTFVVEGQPLTSKTLAGGNPFHFSCLEDKYGGFLGLTSTGGNCVFDMFCRTEQRKNYNAVIAGLMGSGKSTLLKKLFKDRAMRGDYIRAFDISGEFTVLTKEFGGRVLKMDGTEGLINPLEILKADESENNNYSVHMAKQITLYRSLKPEATIEEINMYQQVLDELYKRFDLVPVKDGKENEITGLPVDRYPIFSDFLNLIAKLIEEKMNGEYTEIEKEVVVYEVLLLKKVQDTITTNMKIYGSLFNGYTSIKLDNEQIITFDISGLKNVNSGIFQALLYIMIFQCYNDGVINGSYMKSQYEEGKISFQDITRFLIIIDEAPRIINTKTLQAIEIINMILREGRKYFIGLIPAAQSITSFFPTTDAKSIAEISSIFENAQYKFMFQQDESVMQIIDTIYGGNLTPSQKAKIPKLETGQCLLTISGLETYMIDVYASQEELDLFRGGV